MKIVAYKGVVTVDKASIVEPELKQLLHELEDVIKDTSIFDRVCIFIFLLCDLSNDNPLVDRPWNTRREEALSVAFGSDLTKFVALKDSNEKIRDLINKFIEVYLNKVNTDEQKDIATYSKKMDQFRVMLHDMKPIIAKNVNEFNEKITYSTNMDIINSVLSDIVSLIQAKASMIALHTTGQIPKHLRGGLSPLAHGGLIIESEPEILLEPDTQEEDESEE